MAGPYITDESIEPITAVVLRAMLARDPADRPSPMYLLRCMDLAKQMHLESIACFLHNE